MRKLTTRSFMATIFFLFFNCMLIQNLHAQKLIASDSLSGVLIGKEKEMFDAISKGDKQAAQRLYGEDYITINADGKTQDKQEAMQTIEKFKGSAATPFNRTVRVYDNVAIINGKAKFYVKGILLAEVLYTETWTYRNANWEFIGWQGTMTGLPSWYPVIATIFLLIVFYLIVRRIRKKRKSNKLKQFVPA